MRLDKLRLERHSTDGSSGYARLNHTEGLPKFVQTDNASLVWKGHLILQAGQGTDFKDLWELTLAVGIKSLGQKPEAD